MKREYKGKRSDCIGLISQDFMTIYFSWPGLPVMLLFTKDRGNGRFQSWRVSCEERPPKVNSPKRHLGMQQRMQVKLRSTRQSLYPAMTCPLRLNGSTVSDSIFMNNRKSSRGMGCTACGTDLQMDHAWDEGLGLDPQTSNQWGLSVCCFWGPRNTGKGLPVRTLKPQIAKVSNAFCFFS